MQALQQDIEDHSPEIEELRQLVLELGMDTVEPKHALTDVEMRSEKLSYQASELVSVLEQAHNDHHNYRQTLHNAEKWVMQMSFKLMTFNALNVGTLDLTKQQIDKQKVNIQSKSCNNFTEATQVVYILTH